MFGLPVETAFRAPADDERDAIEAVIAAGGAALQPLVPQLPDARVRRFDADGCLEFEPRGSSAVRPPGDLPFFEIGAVHETPWETGPGGLYAIYVLVDERGTLREIQFNFGLANSGSGGPSYSDIAQWVRARCGIVVRRELP